MVITCSNCQQTLTPGARFCSQCGTQFEKPVPGPAEMSTRPLKSQKQNPFMVVIVGVIGIFVVVGLIGSLAGQSNSSSVNQPDSTGINQAEETVAEPESKINLANYNRIQNGMSYEEVKAILGKEGTELSSNDIAGYKTVMYQWEGNSFANMNAMFQNGKMIQKAQFGLK